MKKGIERLKEEIGDLPITDTVFISDGLSYIDSAVSVTSVYDLIYHLEESEVLSQEWIRNNQERKGVHFFVNVTKLQNLIVPKQELSVVPTWFDEWWKDIPKGGGNLFYNIGRFQDELFSFETREAYDYITDPDNKKKLLDIIVNELEYEVEEEPKYHALIKGHELVHDYDVYWNYDKYDRDVFVSRLHPPHDNFTTEMSKREWIKIGINDSNADFVEVEEMAE